MSRGRVLAGITVVDFSEQVPGPNATRLLTGLGADVIKVERPDEGDRLRHRPALFESQNRGKRSLAIDLKDERGRAAVLGLVADADVVVEGYRPGVMARLGLGFDDLVKVNPKLIYVSISGYGASGPYRDLPGHDFQYLSHVGAIPAPRPEAVAEYVPTTLPIADLGAAQYAVLSIVLGLYERSLEGADFRARHVDVAMADCALSMMEPRIAEALSVATTAEALRRPGYGVFATRDRRLVTIGALEDHFWRRLTVALELPSLRDPKYATFPERRMHVVAIDELLRPRLAEFDQADLVKLLLDHDVPVAPVNDLHQPVSDPHFLARGMVTSNPAPPTTRVAEWPVALDTFADREHLTAAPAIGEHSAEVLAAGGLTDEQIAELVAAGVVRMAT